MNPAESKPQKAAYTGRFAPSPTGPLHAGSLVAALASWLDARAQGGRWLVRIEDVDTPRCVPGADRLILRQLADCGLTPDEAPVWQSTRQAHYQRALDRLRAMGLAYACGCSRKSIEAHWQARGVTWARHQAVLYPGTCRPPLGHWQGSGAPAWRFKVPDTPAPLGWHDRRLGPQQQHLPSEVGDFVLQRADGLWGYQLAVVVDDAAQGVTHVVRGEDLADNTARQIALQRALGLPTPEYLHTPLVRDAQGDKLSKQTGAPAVDTATPETALAALQSAAQVLGLPTHPGPVNAALSHWRADWARRHSPMQQQGPDEASLQSRDHAD